jgi:hypothetical protein
VAFLHQEYPASLKPLYIVLTASVAKVCNLDPKVMYRVKEYIYGLPDATSYYIAYRNHLIVSSFVMTTFDLLVRLMPEQGLRTYVWIHVDDAKVESNHEKNRSHERMLKL